MQLSRHSNARRRLVAASSKTAVLEPKANAIARRLQATGLTQNTTPL
jgi:hypothetical protein